MSNALFAFEDRDAGQRAAQRLIDEGIPPEAVQRHAHTPYEDSSLRQADEQLTGGLLTNLADLFRGVFEWGSSPHDATAAFEETVRRGGMVVSVDVDGAEACDTVDEVMLAARCDRRTGWSDPPAQ